jgi:hypothetical protein
VRSPSTAALAWPAVVLMVIAAGLVVLGPVTPLKEDARDQYERTQFA